MKRLNRLRNARPKALFGADGAITAAATLAASAINAAATSKAAKEQASAIEANARSASRDAAEMRKLESELNNEQMNLIKTNFEKRLAFDKQAITNNLLKGAAESEDMMRRNAAIQVKNGGIIKPKRRRLRSAYEQNIPGISFPDKGGAQLLGYTPNGIVAILRGPSHNNGGVDVDANGRKGVEAEGGEIMKVEYQNGGNVNDVKFISKHDLPGTGFNPAESVLAGVMTPDEAFNTQEYIKDINGISDDGRAKYGTKSPLRRMRCGGRKKADLGAWWKGLNSIERNNIAGSGLTFAGNLLGTGINAWSNWSNANRVASAQKYAADLMSDTYANLPVIDANFLDSLKHQNAIAVTQTPNYIDRYSRTANERALHRTLGNIDRNSLSGAAASNRRAIAEINAGDNTTKIANDEAKINQSIIQNNIATINDTIQKNVASQNEFNNRIAAIKADILSEKYQQLRENKLGASQYKAQGRLDSTQTLTSANQQNWANLAGTIASGFTGIGNTLATKGKMQHELEMSRYGWTAENNLNYVIREHDLEEAKRLYKRYKGAGGQYDIWATELEKYFDIDKLNS